MARCEVTGKSRHIGHHVSHANNKNKREFRANVQKVRIVEENGTVRRAYVSAKALRSNAVRKAAPRRVLLAIQKELSAE